MSRQTSLDVYFKKKSNISSLSEQMSESSSRKRLNLELTIAPTGAKIIRSDNNSDEDGIINLCSDDETDNHISPNLHLDNGLYNQTPLSNGVTKNESMNTSHKKSTIEQMSDIKANFDITSTPTGRKTKRISENNSGEDVHYSDDETECDVSPNLTGDSLHNSTSLSNKEIVESMTMNMPHISQNQCTPTKRSSGKYFSPTKNRLVQKRSPAKKNLAQELFQGSDTSEDLDSSQDDLLDIKSSILLRNINKMDKNTSLSNLLDEKSLDILNKCLQVEQPGLKLVCRLYWRKHIWYRFEKLLKICQNKENVSMDSCTIRLIVNSLVENGMLVQNSSKGANSLVFEELTKTLKDHELRKICKDLKLKVHSKEKGINSLKNYCNQKPISTFFNSGPPVLTNQERVINMMKVKVAACYKLSESAKIAISKLYLLMYLGINYSVIREKKLEWTIIYDKLKKETFPVDKSMVLDNASCVFSSRQEFESYLQAQSIRDSFLAESNSDQKCNIVETVYKSYQNIEEAAMTRYMSYPEWLRGYTPPHIYIKILDNGVQDLKRQKKPESYLLAMEILTTLISQKNFGQHRIGDWYAEKALILHKYLRGYDEAAVILIEGFKSDISDVAKETMQPRAIRISRQQNTYISETLRETLRFYAMKQSKLEKDLPFEYIFKKPMENDGRRGKIKFIVRMGDERHYMNVEDYCTYHCTSDGGFTHAEHWEGRIVTTIFHLLFWEIIYTKPSGISGVFLTYYQHFPLDMYYESFYVNRKVLIDDRLSKISQYTEEQLLEDMKHTWLKRPENELSGIVRKIGWDNISMVTSCLGPEKVAIICRRLATNYRYTNNGFPDVTAWNNITKKIKFLEVKSDSDKPSIKQIQWMHFLHDNGIDTGFFYVGANPNRNKSRAIQIFEECDDEELL